MFLLDASIYMDNTYLLYWGTSPLMEDSELIDQVQSSTNDFSLLAKASGGTLKPSKCFVYFLIYKAWSVVMRLKSLKNLPTNIGKVEFRVLPLRPAPPT